MTPVDLNLYKSANLSDNMEEQPGRTFISSKGIFTQPQIEDSKLPIVETLKNNGFDMNILKDIVEIPIYVTGDLTWHDSFGKYFDEVNKQYSILLYDTPEEIIKISDYNKIAKLYGLEQYELKEDEYIVVCNFDNIKNIRNEAINAGNTTMKLKENLYHLKYNECKDGFVIMSTSHTNTGLILVPDNCPLTDDMQERYLLVANYNANTDEEKEKIHEMFLSSGSDSGFIHNLNEKGIEIDGVTKISLIESSTGLATIVTFIAIYLGVIFLIASSAILALKQLTDSSDNKQRYNILRKIGCDEKMINKALFRQIGIFFGVPLLLAIIHSIFGIQFAVEMMSGLASKEDLLPSAIATVVIIGVIYGAYFLATYFGSKNIIKEEEY